MADRERQRRVRARERPQVQVRARGRRGPQRVDDHDLAGSLGQPVLVLVGGRRRGVSPPYEDATCVRRGPRVKALLGGSIQVLQREMPRLIADRVRIDLAGAKHSQETKRKREPQQRERARVVGIENRPSAGIRGGDPPQFSSGAIQRLLPAHLPQFARSLGASAQQRLGQAGRRVNEHTVVSSRALATQLASADRMVTIAANVPDCAVPYRDLDPARVITVPRTGSKNRPICRCERHRQTVPPLASPAKSALRSTIDHRVGRLDATQLCAHGFPQSRPGQTDGDGPNLRYRRLLSLSLPPSVHTIASATKRAFDGAETGRSLCRELARGPRPRRRSVTREERSCDRDGVRDRVARGASPAWRAGSALRRGRGPVRAGRHPSQRSPISP